MTKRILPILCLLVPAALALVALPASAVSTVVLHYAGTNVAGTLAKDTSGYHNRGTLHRVTWTGRAYSFSRPVAYIQTSASPTVNPGTSSFSYSVSMQLPASTVFSHDLSLVRRGSSKFGGAYYKMEMVYNSSSGNMHLECAYRDQTGVRGFVSTSGNALNDGAWHTLTCSKTRTTVSLTKDGRVYTRPASLGNLSSQQPLFFGVEQVSATGFWEHFPGLMKNITLTKG
jgi:hypothetical protein